MPPFPFDYSPHLMSTVAKSTKPAETILTLGPVNQSPVQIIPAMVLLVANDNFDPLFPATPTTRHNPTLQAMNRGHPPYEEMIIAAIETLRNVNGSSRKMISEYIEANYSDLPPNHHEVLKNNLYQLKNNGRLVFFRQLFMIPNPPERSIVQALLAPVCRNSDVGMGESSGVRSRPNVATRTTTVVASSTVGRPRGRPRKFGPSPTTLAVGVASPNVARPSSSRARAPEITMVPFASDVSDAHTVAGPLWDRFNDRLGDLAIHRHERTPGLRFKKNISQGVSAVRPRSPLTPLERIFLKNVKRKLQMKVKESITVLVKAQLASKSGSLKAAMLQLQSVADMDLRTLLPKASEIESLLPVPAPVVQPTRRTPLDFDLNLPPADV